MIGMPEALSRRSSWPSSFVTAIIGWNGFATMFSFIVALIIGLAYCWKKGALEWES